MSIITFIGAGQMSSALSFPVTQNGHEVRLVGTPLDREIINEARKTGFHITLKKQLPITGIKYYQIEELTAALEGTDAVLCGVSSFGVDWFSENILPVIPENVPLLSVTKGMINMADGSMMTYSYYFASRLPSGKKLSINSIGGPCSSNTLANGDHSAVAFCGDNIDTLRMFKKIFECPYYHISFSTDVVGVECALALKNAYSLGVSLAIGLAEDAKGTEVEHHNSQTAIFGQSVKEMKHLLQLVGGGEENIIYGAGDLYVTVFGGRTRKINTLLNQGFSFESVIATLDGVTLESIVIATRTASSVRHLAEKGIIELSDFPLLIHVDNIINNGASVNIPWKAFETEKF